MQEKKSFLGLLGRTARSTRNRVGRSWPAFVEITDPAEPGRYDFVRVPAPRGSSRLPDDLDPARIEPSRRTRGDRRDDDPLDEH